MLKRFILAFLLLTAAFSVRALEYTDVFYVATQPGKGLFLVQSDTFQFIAFFIYGPNNNPTWYTAQITDDGTGKYTGPLYKTTGTFFAMPWNPADLTINAVGTATFQPTDSYHAMLTYTVTGVGTVTEMVVRQTLTPHQMAGDYSGSMAGSISGCTNPAQNDPAFRGRYGLAVTEVDDSSATLVFTFVDTNHNGIVCTETGPLTHFGRLYQMVGTIACTGPGQDGLPRPATIDSLHPTGQGIEGKLSGPAGGGGCAVVLHFSAVKNVN
jgi:hypothetical protein